VNAGPVAVEPCRAVHEIQAILASFTQAVNSGDRAAIEAAVSPSAHWFSLTTSGGNEVAYGHDDIVSHLVAMSAAGDRFITTPTPDQVTLVAWDGAGHFGLTAFTFERNGQRHRLVGKGALYCGGSARGVEVMGLAD
jgi:hypothetical protein